MANSFFQFKQFTVHQSEAALKVCTESCIFGATIPVEHAQHILDIGTGTGLLALMLAQRSPATIEAIELDEASARDAQKNFLLSPWKDRLTLHNRDIKEFHTDKKYDLIVCNPPFFIQQLKAADARTNAALHGSELKPEDLCRIANELATVDGKFFVLLPERELNLLRHQFKQSGWHLIYDLSIYQQADKSVFRKIAGFSKEKNNDTWSSNSFYIYKEGRTYSDDFITLLKEYYLYL